MNGRTNNVPTRSTHGRKAFLAALCIGMLLSGCVGHPIAGRLTRQASSPQQVSMPDLRAALGQFEDYLQETIKQAAADLDERMPEPNVRRNTLLWKMRLIPACQAAMRQDDALKAFVDCWTLAVRMREYLETGEGRSLFGEHQSIAVDAARRIEADIERIGTSFLPDDRLAKAGDEVKAFAAEHPMRGVFGNVVQRAPAP